ncbi:MAG: TonB family protein [Acidobacteriia bacterium]|nr:TonB family protein [Terriglobia bacterium]
MARARHGWMDAPAALREQLSFPAWTRLYIDPHIGPCAVGWLRAAVILPVRIFGGTTPAALRQITLHESCHARWRDPQINSLLRLLRAALWPSVPLWYLQHLIQMEREAAADQAAIAGTPIKGESDQVTLDYAAVLISIAQWPQNSRCSSFSQAAPHAGSRSRLENRVSRLLKESPHLSLTRSTFGVVALLSGFIGTAFLPAAVFDPAIPSSGNAARSIGGIPIRADNQAEGPLLISCAGFTTIDNGRIQASVALLNNTSRRIAGFRMRLAHGYLPFERVFHIYGVKIEPRQSYLANLDWQQGHQPDWHAPNAGLLQVLEVQFEGDARAQSENLPPRIVVNNPGGGTILVSKTASGEVEEPILKKSEAELISSATERAAPAYPGGGIGEQNSNAVLVSVLIDESGNVIRARAVAGNRDQLAEERAVEAARKWKFVPAVAEGVPIKEFGSLTFFGQMDFSRGWISIR